MCACHGTTICPDEIFLGYENDVPIYVRRDSQEGAAEIARRTAAPLPHPADPVAAMREANGATIIDRINREAAEWRERALKAERELNEALAAGREALRSLRLQLRPNSGDPAMTHSHEAASVQTLTPEQLDALKALEAAATKAPWVKKGSSGDSSVYLMNEERFLAESSWHGNSAAFPTRIGTNANFDFLVAIRNAAPTLIEFAQQHAAATERAKKAERERDEARAESARTDEILAGRSQTWFDQLDASLAERDEARAELEEIETALVAAGQYRVVGDDTTRAGRIAWLKEDCRRLHKEKLDAIYGEGGRNSLRTLIARAVEAIEPLEAEANNYGCQRSDAILIELPIHLRDIRRLAALAADLRRAGEGA